MAGEIKTAAEQAGSSVQGQPVGVGGVLLATQLFLKKCTPVDKGRAKRQPAAENCLHPISSPSKENALLQALEKEIKLWRVFQDSSLEFSHGVYISTALSFSHRQLRCYTNLFSPGLPTAMMSLHQMNKE